MAHHLQADERQRDPATFEAVHRWGLADFVGPLEKLDVKNIQAEDAERLRQAEPLFRRALALEEATFSPDHSKVAMGLNNPTRLLQATNRPADAVPLSAQAMRILLTNRSLNHPNNQTAKGNHPKIPQVLGRSDAEIQIKLDALDRLDRG
jgi:hypothetical protein